MPRFAAAAVLLAALPAHADDGREAFRAIYKELIEINTTLSEGSCTEASEAMSAHLKRAGYPDADLHVIVPPERPKDGNLVAVLHGADPAAAAVLLLAHIDVVEARREDWERDPFILVEEDGYFYARGASDDKAMAAVFVDSLVRFRNEGYTPRRTIKLALTCGEETPDTFNGVEYLLANHRELIDAGLAINEGAGGRLDEDDNRVFLGIQAGEKLYQDYRLEVTNPGGHSARPLKDNAIVRLSAGLVKLGDYDFPIALNQTVTAHFAAMSGIETGPLANLLKAAAEGTADEADLAAIAADPSRNAMMRTTCVATEVDAGHAKNALPQRAVANVNCRILPGQSVEDVRRRIEAVLDDPGIAVTLEGNQGLDSPAPPLTDKVMTIAREVAGTLWPGVPLVPVMTTGATDGRFLNAAGIPTYGLSGMFVGPDGTGAHGLNERLRVKSLYESRDFLHAIARRFADAPD